ncbi:MAG TPA: DUF2062 domain-containing protein [Victivallales bacterium]|nr:DUF2062 domain-containing protein [Victivallales bacterium]
MFRKTLRIFKKYYYRLLRSDGSPHSIALAIALGFFIGCLIPIGGQTVIIIILAIIFRTDKVLAFAATWISNPYTVVVMYPIFCYVGAKVARTGLTFAYINERIAGIIHNFSWHGLFSLGSDLALSFLVGGFIFGVIIGGIGYLFTYILVVKYRKVKELNLRIKKVKRYKELKKKRNNI